MSCLWVLTCEAYATPFLHHWNFCLLIVTSIQLWAVAVVMGPFPLQSGQQTATARQRNIQSTAEVTSASNTTYRVPSKQQRSPPHQTQSIVTSKQQRSPPHQTQSVKSHANSRGHLHIKHNLSSPKQKSDSQYMTSHSLFEEDRKQ